MPPMLILGPAHLAFRSLLGFAAKCVFTLLSEFDSSLPRVVLPDIVCLPQASAVFCGNVCMFVCVINSLSLCVFHLCLGIFLFSTFTAHLGSSPFSVRR